jgi:RNA polymerase sigma-70 factor (ECF subfamily)
MMAVQLVRKSKETVLTYINDKKTVSKLLSGDESDFKRFFDEYFPRLYRFASDRLNGNPDEVRDVVQSTLSKTLLNLDKYKGESALFTWMCAICKNEIYDHLKKRAKYERNIVLKGGLLDEDLAGTGDGQSNVEQPVEHYQREQSTQLIHKVLDSLPAEYGNIIEWKYIEGLSVKEIAIKLGLSDSATQSALYRARVAFQESHNQLT